MFLYNLIYKVMGVQFGKNVSLQGMPVIVNRGQISIGSGTTIKSSFLSNLIGLYQRTVIVARIPSANVKIGERVGLSGVTIYAREKIQIGNDCKIGGNTKIMDNDFHPVDPVQRLECSNRNMGVKAIEIGDNVFIGCNCLILKGAQIGDNSTIGAGSVVTGYIPDNCIAAGNPAKVIKYFS